MTDADNAHSTAIKSWNRIDAMQRVVGVFTLILMGLSWPLWLGSAAFPQVPLLGFLTQAPNAIDILLTSAALLAWGAAVIGGHPTRLGRFSLAIAVLSMVLLMFLNQHRLQPWAYLSVLVGLLLATCPKQQSLPWLRAIFVSIYIYSALGKLDYLFSSTVGQQMLSIGLSFVGLSIELWSPALQRGVALLLPLGELLVGILLFFSITRKCGVALAVVLHLALIMILGPFGMSQKPGVLVWNLQFCLMIPLLFWPTKTALNETAQAAREAAFQWPSVLARGVAVLAIVLPLLEPFALWDPWLSWGLYSTRAPRAEVYVADNIVSRISPSLRKYLSDDVYNGYLRKVHLDRWSLDALNVPLYPHERFGVGVSLAIINDLGVDRGVMVVRSSVPNRWTGERVQLQVTKLDEIKDLPEAFRWNANPRRGLRLRPLQVDPLPSKR